MVGPINTGKQGPEEAGCAKEKFLLESGFLF